MTTRVKCRKCTKKILEQTARDNGGLCAPCFYQENPRPSPYEKLLKIPASQLDKKQKHAHLQGAMYNENLQRINELLSGRTDFLSKPPSEFHTWLGLAVSNGCDIAILEKLLAAGCDPNIGSESPDHTTPLERAVQKAHFDAIHWLLKKGADPNIGRPLVGAIMASTSPESKLNLLTLLINAGADVIRSYARFGDESDRFTVLDHAKAYKLPSAIIKFLMKHGAKQYAKLDKSVKDSFHEQAAGVDRRKLYVSLDAGILRDISDEELEQAIIEHVAHRLKSGSGERTVIRSLSEGSRALWLTWMVECEVGNGGFNQYYWNTNGRYSVQAVTAFEFFSASEHAALMREANAVRKKEATAIKKFKDKNTLKAFSDSYKVSKLRPLDDRFCSLKENLSSLRIAKIRQDPKLFISKC